MQVTQFVKVSKDVTLMRMKYKVTTDEAAEWKKGAPDTQRLQGAAFDNGRKNVQTWPYTSYYTYKHMHISERTRQTAGAGRQLLTAQFAVGATVTSCDGGECGEE